MGDLPAAGAVWFACGRSDAEAQVANQTWVERYGDDPVQMWRSLPRPIRDQPTSDQVRALHSRASSSSVARGQPGAVVPANVESRVQRWLGGLGCVAFVLSMVGLIGIGLWTVVTWLFR
jgi:hypothetical protein